MFGEPSVFQPVDQSGQHQATLSSPSCRAPPHDVMGELASEEAAHPTLQSWEFKVCFYINLVTLTILLIM